MRALSWPHAAREGCLQWAEGSRGARGGHFQPLMIPQMAFDQRTAGAKPIPTSSHALAKAVLCGYRIATLPLPCSFAWSPVRVAFEKARHPRANTEDPRCARRV